MEYGIFLGAGYFFLIAFAWANDLKLLQIWIELWQPMVDLLSAFLPRFEAVENRTNKTFAASVAPVFMHLLAVGWIGAVIAACATFALACRNRRAGLVHLASQFTRARLVALLSISLIGIAIVGALYLLVPQLAFGIGRFRTNWTTTFVLGATAAGGCFFLIYLCLSMLLVVSAALLERRRFVGDEH